MNPTYYPPPPPLPKKQPRKLYVYKHGDTFVVDEQNAPGSPPVGRGPTLDAALGDWCRNHLYGTVFTVDVLPTAQEAEDARRGHHRG